ncbi:MAG: hypothetical protein GWP59_06110 [Chlamydiales bacterium]|nr:hypothetical protein [Chlamydiales bacterium]
MELLQPISASLSQNLMQEGLDEKNDLAESTSFKQKRVSTLGVKTLGVEGFSLLPAKPQKGVFSTVFKLPYLIHFLENSGVKYALVAPESHFPEYLKGSELNILCEDTRALKKELQEFFKPYQAKGCKLKCRGREELNFSLYLPREKQKNLSINLLPLNYLDRSSSSFKAAFLEKALGKREQVERNGVDYASLNKEDELIVRFVRSSRRGFERKESLQDLAAVRALRSVDFYSKLKEATNLNLSSKAFDKILKKAPANLRSERMLLLYPFAEPYKNEILKRVREFENIQIERIQKISIPSFSKLFKALYEKDASSGKHAKMKWYLKNQQRFVYVLQLREFWNKTEGSKLSNLSELLKSQLNDKDKAGERSERDILTQINNYKQLARVKSFLKIRKRSCPVIENLNLPFWSFSYPYYKVSRVPVRKLLARVIVDRKNGRSIIQKRAIEHTPHFEFAKGKKEAYVEYYHRFGAAADHSPEAFERLVKKYQESYIAPNGKKDIPIVFLEDGKNLEILDGFHRCAIHAARGLKNIEVLVFSKIKKEGFKKVGKS